MFQRFKREHRGAFSESQAITMGVKWTARGWRQGLKRIEAGKNQLAQGVITASEHPLGVATPHQFPGVPDSVGPGSAGVADDGDWPTKAEGVHDIQRLALRLIMENAGRLAGPGFRELDGLPIKGLAEVHSAAGR